MSDRPVFHKKIGEELTALRKAKGWSVPRAVLTAKGRGFRAPTAQALRWLEEGRTRHPDADVLKAVADLYGLDYAALALRVARENYEWDLAAYGRDLVRHAVDQGSVHGLAGGTADELVAAPGRLEELENRVSVYESALGALENVVKQLTDIAAVREQGGTPVSRPAGRGRRPRKTG